MDKLGVKRCMPLEMRLSAPRSLFDQRIIHSRRRYKALLSKDFCQYARFSKSIGDNAQSEWNTLWITFACQAACPDIRALQHADHFLINAEGRKINWLVPGNALAMVQLAARSRVLCTIAVDDFVDKPGIEPPRPHQPWHSGV
ncbi:hypothetical protein [Pseudomonas sp. PDM11]|uniref:hypothetical protein n=1 Tax=Pseudomonas sp. PDM11 TaxID=2769309 RepID=UPI00177F29EB|nr:hypothetical protein [Pseudomonas sp. PDM11]MBD9396524.1 hypothetical protein [Pseudomonas sp. PDM11]